MSDDEENNNETKVGQTRIYRPIDVSLDVAVESVDLVWTCSLPITLPNHM